MANDIEKLEKELKKLKEKDKKQKKEYSKIIVSLIIIINILFTIAIMILFLKQGSEPVALIGAWFSFTTVELWNLAKIKQHKINKEI
ncbi:hypothetical protein HMPREF9628_01285 [Peptoanaerobacter stomatis]|uniref:2TM domain-containing protein n=1 Tax=Peptoanaerobacter stomatis TaxID=796937 RepID=G9XBB8_9FIRM|nr:hypothetical protein [Peptoanaerobacter stomatis]EHL19769.1 hypothetical protein HMPREF9628_01285 [Peptoanaerobacter stomatis]